MGRINKWLLASVALNILLIGIVAGHAFLPHGFKHGGRGQIPAHIQDSLSPEQLAAYVDSRTAMQEAARTARQKRHQLMEELTTILAAPDFDAQAFARKTEEIKAQHLTGMDALFTHMTETAQTLTAEQRQELANHLQKRHQRKFRQR